MLAESSVGARRRRSSVPSYSFNEEYYSDSNEFDSPEEEFSSSSDDDSDEEWEIPSKRARTRKGSRGGSSSKNESPSAVGRPRRKCRQTSSNAASAKSEDDSEPSSTTAATESGPLGEEVAEQAVKSEPLETEERPAASEIASKEAEAAPAPKPPPKLKVIDLAKLKGVDPPNDVTLRKPPDSNALMIRAMPTLNSLPMIRACVAQRMNSPASTVQPQPTMMVRSANLQGSPAYVVSRPNTFVMTSFRRPATPLNTPISARGPHQSVLRNIVPPNFANMTNTSMIRQALVAKQMVRVPTVSSSSSVSMGSRAIQSMPVSSQPVIMMRKSAPTTYNGTQYRTIAPIPKVMLPPNNAVNQPMMMKSMMQRRPSVREIEGTIGIHSDNGHLQYVVNLANGSHVPLTNEQVQKLRDGNRGVLPQKLKIPVPADVAEKIEPCVVLDD